MFPHAILLWSQVRNNKLIVAEIGPDNSYRLKLRMDLISSWVKNERKLTCAYT